jgi:Fic family protein
LHRAVEEGRELATVTSRARHEVTNYFAALRHIEKRAAARIIRHEDIFILHRILAQGVMEEGEAGRYRTIPVRVGTFVPPLAAILFT